MEAALNKTKLGLKIALSVMAVSIIQGAFTLLRTNIVLNAYGDKINGIVQVALQMSAYLALFQNGMSAAYQYSMYAPFHQQNFLKISGLFAGLRKSMARISVKLLAVSIVIVPLYAALLIRQGVEYLNTVFIMAVIGVRLIAPYVLTLSERCLIDIREKRYLVNTIEGVKDCLSLLTEILLISYTNLPLPVILSFNLIFVFITKRIYIRIVKKDYGQSLSMQSEPDYSPAKMTKDVMIHQVASVATSNTDGVLLSIASSLTNVTIYGAFSTLIIYPSLVISRIIEGMRASLALKITREDENSYSAFREMLAFSFFCICFIVPSFLVLANPFVSLWLGEQYQINNTTLIFFGLMLADSFFMPPVYAARDAKGLYRESKGYAVIQAVLNVAVSIVLVVPFGIAGVLAGTLAALYLVLQPCNLYLVYSRVFHRKMTIYLDMAGVALLCVLSYLLLNFTTGSVFPDGTNTWFTLMKQILICGVIVGPVAMAGLWLINREFRSLVLRFLFLFKRGR